MKIATIVREFRKDCGLERAAYEISKSLATRGHKLSIISSIHHIPPSKNFEYRHIPCWNWRTSTKYLSFKYLTKHALKNHSFDIIHAHGTESGLGDVLTMQSCHRAGIEQRKRYSHLINPYFYWHIADRIILLGESEWLKKRRYKKIIAVSSLLKREIIQYYNIPDNDIFVIPNGVNTEEFSPKIRILRDNIRKQYKLTRDDFTIIFVGNEFSRKGLEILIRAIHALKRINIRVIICGKDNPSKFIDLIKTLRMQNQFIFTGMQNDIRQFYSAADLFVLPTLHEAFGMVITEAMACGLPVIVSRNAGAAEDIISDGIDGLLLANPLDVDELAEKIKLLFEDEKLREKLGKMANQKVQFLSWDIITDRIINVYNSIKE